MKSNGLYDRRKKNNRRDFIVKSASHTALLAGCLTAVSTQTLRAEKAKPINPGYVGPQYYDVQEKKELTDVVDSGSPFRFWGKNKPRKTADFEHEFSQYMGAPYSLAVNSGTSALNCAMAGLGVGPGDEVIVPAYSWWSDYTCVINSGALPVFADIDSTFNIDPKDFEQKISPRTKAVIACHLMGGLCDLEPILAIAKKHNVKVVEDCAQCVGGSFQEQKLGTFGDVGIYSFQVNKMISAGEGGALVTSDPMIYERAVRFHDVGIFRQTFEDRTGSHQTEVFPGDNYRMNEFSGGVLLAQIKKLDRMVQDQRGNAHIIREGIKSLKGITFRHQPDPSGDIGYCIGIKMETKSKRDRCIDELQKLGVSSGPLGGSVLLPIQDSVIHKHVRHPNWPSFRTPEGKAIQYGSDSCRQTLDVYNTYVLLRIGPKYTAYDNQRIIDTFKKVYAKVM